MQQEILFGKYRIIKLLGRGGTASVYLTEHIKLKVFRAIKVISKNHPLYNLQRNEAHILKNLKHSCVPIIYDIEEDENCSFIVEEYLEGITLQEFIKNRDKLSEDIIVHFAIQICDLLNYLHTMERPILYLDLKPSNIIVLGDTIKLIDFGSATYFDKLKKENFYMGTKGFSAPELYKRRDIDEGCDIYSIGMLLLCMVTGKEYSIKNFQLENIDFAPSCSKQLKKVINRCLKQNALLRYHSVKRLQLDLTNSITKVNHSGKYFKKPVIYSIAGTQSRIGVTHLALCICNYYHLNKDRICYLEKNNNNFLWCMKSRLQRSDRKEKELTIAGIPLLSFEQEQSIIKPCNYDVIVKDYGCLSSENLEDFQNGDIKILILGGKEWELTKAEQALKLADELTHINYLFNFVDGRQYQQLMKSMGKKFCYRIPYEPDSFFQDKKSNMYIMVQEIEKSVLVERTIKG